jgi:tetratricopeptide (TPR) repeat protein
MATMNSTTSGRSFSSLQLHPKHLFLPTTLAAVFLLRWKLAMPWWGLAAILSLLPMYYFLLPRVLKKKERDFERGVLRLLQQGRKDELLEYYRRQTFLRLLAPADKLQKRLGFIYSELGDFDRARACYARAAQSASHGERLAVLLGLANARYRSGDYDGAEVVYRELIRRGQHLPEVLSGLAHTLLLNGKDKHEALKMAKKAVDAAPTGPSVACAHLTFAEALLSRGRAGKASRALEEAEIVSGNAWLEARRSWVLALFAVHEGNHDEARELFEDVFKLDEKGGLGDLARHRIAELDGEEIVEEARLVAG